MRRRQQRLFRRTVLFRQFNNLSVGVSASLLIAAIHRHASSRWRFQNAVAELKTSRSAGAKEKPPSRRPLPGQATPACGNCHGTSPFFCRAETVGGSNEPRRNRGSLLGVSAIEQ